MREGGRRGGGGHYVMVLSCAGAVMTRLYTGGKMAIYVHSVFVLNLLHGSLIEIFGQGSINISSFVGL